MKLPVITNVAVYKAIAEDAYAKVAKVEKVAERDRTPKLHSSL